MLVAEINVENSEISSLLNECYGYAVIDCGCSSTVCGETWLNAYLDSLSEFDRQHVLTSSCSRKYVFGDGEEVNASKCVDVPVFLGNAKATLSIDVVPVSIPLLLSKKSLKRGNAKIDFENNVLTILDEVVPLEDTPRGHLIVLLCKLHDIDGSVVERIMFSSDFSSDDTEQNTKKVLKLHRQ